MAIQEISQAILEFDLGNVKELVQRELDSGTDIALILNDGLIGAMDEVGRQFSEGNLFVPEMLRAAQCMKEGLDVLKPHLTGKSTQSRGTIIIGTVKGDLHDIGKNLVSMMMEGAGFAVVDLGVDVAPEKFVKAAMENKADVVALSALLTTTMPSMQATIAAVKESGLSVKTLIGGAPVTKAFAAQIGADGFGADAPGAVQQARQLIHRE